MSEYTVDRWYDRHIKSWVIQLKDADGYQVGEAIFVYSKKEALAITIEDFVIPTY